MSQPSKVINGCLIFNKIPEGYPIPGETTIYKEEELDLNTPLNGNILVKLIAISIDPYLRGRMRAADVESYLPAFEIGQPIESLGVGVVLRSESPKVQPGDHITLLFPLQSYVIFDAEVARFEVLRNPHNLPWSVYIGVVGMPGKTAYFGWKLFANAKKGETVYVSTAAGPVGSVVAQIAKAEGLKVVGSAGSEEKVAFLRDELKLDFAFNYKTTDARKVLKDAGGIDIYWDNVCGDQLDAALEAGRNFMRIVSCGAIASYNGDRAAVRNLHLVFAKRVLMNGFLFGDHAAKPINAEAAEYLAAAVARGDIKYHEHQYSLKEAGQAILDVQKGDNKAKAVIIF